MARKIGTSWETIAKYLADVLEEKSHQESREIAREIFEEIEKILKMQERYLYCNPSLTYVYELIAELKKKYTEGDI